MGRSVGNYGDGHILRKEELFLLRTSLQMEPMGRRPLRRLDLDGKIKLERFLYSRRIHRYSQGLTKVAANFVWCQEPVGDSENN